MARKRIRRDEPQQAQQEIHIQRNVIEEFLMKLKDFVRKHRMIVLYSFIGFIVASVITIGIIVYMDSVSTKNSITLEKLMTDYDTNKMSGNSEKKDRTIDELKKFISSTSFGKAHKMAHYYLGNIYFSEKKYEEAVKYLLLYEDKSSDNIFSTLALLKLAVAYEEKGDLEKALDTYKILEDKHAESIVADQIYYNYARAYAKKKDTFNAKKYYNKVISAYPQSIFASRAKKRLYLIGNM